jgi:hypothetical protein
MQKIKSVQKINTAQKRKSERNMREGTVSERATT